MKRFLYLSLVLAILFSSVAATLFQHPAVAAPAGSITGHVYQNDGVTPIPLAHVVAYDKSTGTLVPVAVATASADGSYRTTGEGSGSYLVMAQIDGWKAEYWNNVPDSTSATLVDVTAGNDTPNIDFTLAPTLVISSVDSSGITETGATITWTTNEPASSEVHYGSMTKDCGVTRVVDETMVTSHSVVLTDLKAGNTYACQVTSMDADRHESVLEYRFTTAGRRSDSGWVDTYWVIIGLAAVAVIGGVACFIRLAKH